MAEMNPPLAWEDFSALAPWLAFEISGAYTMDKKSFEKHQSGVPFVFKYRVPVRLCHEETTLLALVIKQIFRYYWRTGKTTGFKPVGILLWDTAKKLGMERDTQNPRLRKLCRQFAEKFPAFIDNIQKDGIKNVVI